jgi:hypothetical protein
MGLIIETRLAAWPYRGGRVFQAGYLQHYGRIMSNYVQVGFQARRFAVASASEISLKGVRGGLPGTTR